MLFLVSSFTEHHHAIYFVIMFLDSRRKTSNGPKRHKPTHTDQVHFVKIKYKLNNESYILDLLCVLTGFVL